MQKPVAKRSGIAPAALATATRPRFAAAAPNDPYATRSLGAIRSARLSPDETRAPATNPSWTAIVSQEAELSESPQSARSCGITAEAENHVVIERTRAAASSESARHRPRASGTGSLSGAAVRASGP